MFINNVDTERVRSRFRDCLASLDTIEDEISNARAAGFDVDTLDHEQEALVACMIELATAAASELQKLIID